VQALEAARKGQEEAQHRASSAGQIEKLKKVRQIAKSKEPKSKHPSKPPQGNSAHPAAAPISCELQNKQQQQETTAAQLNSCMFKSITRLFVGFSFSVLLSCQSAC
jgi:hypothetical protein